MFLLLHIARLLARKDELAQYEELLKELTCEIDEKLDGLQAPINGVVLRRRTIFMG